MGVVLVATLAAWGWLTKKRLENVAGQLELKLRAPSQGREGLPVTVDYSLSNPSQVGTGFLSVVDVFRAGSQKLSVIPVHSILESGETISLTESKLCDGGMGTYRLGPPVTRIMDGVGVFEFLIEDDSVTSDLKVYPKILELPAMPVKPNEDSLNFGLIELKRGGFSVNFSGVREYVRGDSLRHIAWKLSAKHSKLLVKEFEKTINSDVCVMINMDGSLHVGEAATSTWEYAKDLALAYLSEQFQSFNRVQVVSNNFAIESGRGTDLQRLIVERVSALFPSVDKAREHFLKRNLLEVAPGSTLIYILPVYREMLDVSVGFIKQMQAELRIKPLLVLIDAGSFVQGKLFGFAKLIHSAVDAELKPRLQHNLDLLNFHEIPWLLVSEGKIRQPKSSFVRQ